MGRLRSVSDHCLSRSRLRVEAQREPLDPGALGPRVWSPSLDSSAH